MVQQSAHVVHILEKRYCTPVCRVSSLVYHKCPQSSWLSPLMYLKCPPASRQGVLAYVSFELLQVLIVGNGAVGKSSMIQRWRLQYSFLWFETLIVQILSGHVHQELQENHRRWLPWETAEGPKWRGDNFYVWYWAEIETLLFCQGHKTEGYS